MLDELAKKDDYWRKIAKNICKDDYLADDLVNEMYLKLHDCKKQINDFYVKIVIRTLFLDYCRKKKYNVSIDEIDIRTEKTFEADDFQSNLLEKASKLKFYEIELLDMSGEHSLRELATRYNINYQTINRIVSRARAKIWQNKNKAED